MALTIQVKVVPSSGRSSWQLDKNGQLKCFLKSAPEAGAANKELVKTLAKLLGVTQSDVEIVRGLTERTKFLKIHTDLSQGAFLEKLGLAQQLSL